MRAGLRHPPSSAVCLDQREISAAHQCPSVANEALRPAERVADFACGTGGHPLRAEEADGDLAIARAFKAAVERAQAERELIERIAAAARIAERWQAASGAGEVLDGLRALRPILQRDVGKGPV